MMHDFQMFLHRIYSDDCGIPFNHFFIRKFIEAEMADLIQRLP